MNWKRILPRWASKKWDNLTFRLLYVVCCTFVPTNLVAILVAGLVMTQSSNQQLESYDRELTASMERLDRDCERVNEVTDDVVADHLAALMISGESDRMETYEMAEGLAEVFRYTNLKGLVYLYDKREQYLVLKGSGGTYSAREIEDLKKALLENGLPDGTDSDYHMSIAQDRIVLTKYYEYTNYKAGFLVDLGDSLETALGRETLSGRELFFTDGVQIAEFKDGVFALTEREWRDARRDSLLYRSVEYRSADWGYSVCLHVENGSVVGAIPLLYWILLVISLLCVLLLFGMWNLLRTRVVGPLRTLRDAMESLRQENFDYRITDIDEDETREFRYLYDSFNHMAQEIQASYEKDIQMYQIQLDNLKLQVNPHMLLNSFNMIYSLAQVKNYECIQEFSLCLVEYFRYSLKETDSFVRLEQEMHFVENYTSIQKIRFPGAFTSVHNIEDGIGDALIPPLLIQNFVENAMKYALKPGEMIEVLINIRREDEKLLISISDTGSGIKEEVLEKLNQGEPYVDRMGKKHIGVWNCKRRMELFYGAAARMHIVSSRGEGTQVWLELPYLTGECEKGTGRKMDETADRR